MPLKTVDQFFEESEEELFKRCLQKAEQLPYSLNWQSQQAYPFPLPSQNLTQEASAFNQSRPNSEYSDLIRMAISVAFFAVKTALDTPLNSFNCGSTKGDIGFRNTFALTEGRHAFAQYCSTLSPTPSWYWLFVEIFGEHG